MRFEDLDVWKRAARLCAGLFRALEHARPYAFRDQVGRAALSIASNIAEGYERDSARDRVKFLNYAKGSCGELRTQLYIGMEAGYIERGQGNEWVRETRELSAMLYGLIKALRRQARRRRFSGPSFLALGAWRLALGAWRLALGAWRLALGAGRWALGAWRWALGAGRWALGAGRLALGAGRLALGAWRLALGAGRWALGAGRWALGAGRWALGAGRWALGAGPFAILHPHTRREPHAVAHAWYLIHAKPRQEETALANLARQGYEAFLPRLRRQVRHAGRWRERVEAMFPRYLFLRLAAGDQDWRPVHSTVGVSRLVRFGDEPARVPADLVDYLRDRADAEDIVRIEPTAEFAPGQGVRVIEGPLAGIEGIVRANSARDRVDVLLRIVGECATVRLSRHHLAPT